MSKNFNEAYNEFIKKYEMVGSTVLICNKDKIIANAVSGMKDLVYLGGYYKRLDSAFKNPLPCTYPSWEVYVYDFREEYFSIKFAGNTWTSGVEYCYVIIEYTKNSEGV